MRALPGMLGTLAPLVAIACGGTTIASSSEATSGASSSSSSGTGATTAGSSTTASSAASSGSGGAGGASAGPTIAFGGTVVQVPVNVFLSSVQICVDQHPEIACATSDSQGAFSLSVPANAEVAVTLAKPGYAGIVVPLVTSTQDQEEWEIGLPTSSSTAGFYSGFTGATYPDTTRGFLSVYVTQGTSSQTGRANVVPSMSPSSGEGPIYAGTSLTMADPTLQATSSVGNARFANVSPGIVEVTLGPSTLTCTANFGGWSAPDANAVRVPIVAGFETHVGLACF
jgi:hypothetical protein